MPNLLQQAGASSEPTSFAPLHTNRIFTGLWTNRSVLRDAATNDYQERNGLARQDSILGGANTEITSRLTLRRRSGTSVYNPSVIAPVNRFYSFHTFDNTSERIYVIADTQHTIYDATANLLVPIWNKTVSEGPAFFLGVGNILYIADGWQALQWVPGSPISTQVFNWGLPGPTNAPKVTINPASGAPGTTAPVQYGFAYKSTITNSVSNMSKATGPINVPAGNQVTLGGPGLPSAGPYSNDPQCDVVVLYRTVQGGSTFLWMAEIPNISTSLGPWSFTDTIPDSDLNPLIQAAVNGEGTPLPAGRYRPTCIGYHVGRMFVAVGNLVYISAGPDAVVSGASGNAGFNIVLTAQSRITRFWTCSLGMVVFTVRDAYIILGSGTASDPLYMVTFIEQLPLLHYDAFTVNKTTPMMMLGNNQVVALDPSAGIVEIGFPIADRLEEEFDPTTAFVTYHTQSSRESALYVANGTDHWYRMNQNNAPEQGSAWSPRANIAGLGCVQSVEITPGVYRLLYTGNTPGPILMRDLNANTDNGIPYSAGVTFGSIVMALPGQLAAISFITLESVRVGTRAQLALLLGEISGEFEELNRTRQDPTNLPPSNTLYSDRYHFAQNQKTAWCRHFQMAIAWPAEDAANELLTFTIFGQTWQEMRSQ